MSELTNKLVFVGGLHRSGTTPFTRVLADHPDVSGLTNTGAIEDEGQHLQSVYPPAKTWGGSGHFARDARAHLIDTYAMATPDNADKLMASWTPYWDLSKPYLVEKSPPNLIMGRFLQELFPGAYFIMVVRHPITVALSTRKWTHFLSRNPRKLATLSMLVDHWLIAHRLFEEDRPYLQNVHVLRYEELVSRPTETLRRVQRFLELDGEIPSRLIQPTHSESYQNHWDALKTPLRPGGWQRRAIESRFSADIASYGYSTDDLSWYSPADSALQT